MSVFLFLPGALMLAFAIWRLGEERMPLQTAMPLYLLAAIGSGLVTAAALVALAP